MLAIGLTGGIGSGKSTVAGIFSVLGIPVFDADSEAKKLMHSDAQLQLAIQQQFGEAVYKNGTLDRKALAAIVFADSYQLQLLNAIVHPATIAHAQTWIKNQNSLYVIKEAALLFESGSAGNLHYIVGVYAPRPMRIQRIMQRDHASMKQVQERMDHQIDEEVKMRLCDFVVHNNGEQLLIPQVVALHSKFLLMVKEKTYTTDNVNL
jgi:dephospho-CoA kinase